jgi:hypothetical protein
MKMSLPMLLVHAALLSASACSSFDMNDIYDTVVRTTERLALGQSVPERSTRTSFIYGTKHATCGAHLIRELKGMHLCT